MSEDEKQLQWIRTKREFAEIYANVAHLTWSLDDVRIRLAQLVDNPDTPNPGGLFSAAAEERGAVTITWRAAKLLRDQLTSVVDSYEKVNGEIKLTVKLPPSA
jgi:hypothetical protein